MARASTKTATASRLHTQYDPNKPETNIDKMKRLLLEIGNNWVDFSLTASEVYDSEEFKVLGYQNFKEFCIKELAEEYTTVMYRVRMGNSIKRLGLEKEAIADLGWAKFKELILIMGDSMSQKDVSKLLTMAREKTVKEVQQYVREVRHTSGAGGTDVLTTVTLRFWNEQSELFTKTTAMAMDMLQTEKLEVAVEYILTEWASKYDPNALEAIKSAMPSAERTEAPAPKRGAYKGRVDKGRERVKKEKTSAKKTKKAASKKKAKK